MISFSGDGAEATGVGTEATTGALASTALPSTCPPAESDGGISEGMGVGVFVGVDSGEKDGVEESELLDECDECEFIDDIDDDDGG